MAKKVSQLRYYSNGNNKNYPANITAQDLISGQAFTDFGSIYQIGIQTLPGTKFFLNGSAYPIIIGITGIYELEVVNFSTIKQIQFDSTSISLIENNSNAYLIIDILYENGGIE